MYAVKGGIEISLLMGLLIELSELPVAVVCPVKAQLEGSLHVLLSDRVRLAVVHRVMERAYLGDSVGSVLR